MLLNPLASGGIGTVSTSLDGEGMPSLESMLDDVISGHLVAVLTDDLRIATLQAGNVNWILHTGSPEQYSLSTQRCRPW